LSLETFVSKHITSCYSIDLSLLVLRIPTSIDVPTALIQLLNLVAHVLNDTAVVHQVLCKTFASIVVVGEFKIGDRKSTRLNSSHVSISYAVFCLKKKK